MSYIGYKYNYLHKIVLVIKVFCGKQFLIKSNN